ncbi:MAG: hypothetical protein KatS3mg111_0217 [Pirellulaceae bacterium]|nr:MAG: hypothetical protein KatS3mg111_0217 [Pirellulaceae bacterium]
MKHPSLDFAQRIASTTQRVFGDSEVTAEVLTACADFEQEVQKIHDDRGVEGLVIAVVGAKKQGKSWIVRQLIRDPALRQRIPSGDLAAESTQRLYWIGPQAPHNLNVLHETHLVCPADALEDLGVPYSLIDTPGVTDENPELAEVATRSLSLASVKILVVARDQIRAATNLTILRWIAGALCIPVINFVPPQELRDGEPTAELANDLQQFRQRLDAIVDPQSTLPWVLIPDWEVAGNEQQAGEWLRQQLRKNLQSVDLSATTMATIRSQRIQAARRRLQQRVRRAIMGSMNVLRENVERLEVETRQLPQKVLLATLGDPRVLEAGLRLHLRSRFVGDTWPIWFPYRSAMTVLLWTVGAWDRLMLSLTGSLPSLFGTLVAWAANLRQAKQSYTELQQGVRRRIESQMEEKLQPLTRDFYRSLQRMRQKTAADPAEPPRLKIHLTGLEELQSQSQEIYQQAIDRFATRGWRVQLAGLIGSGIFWLFFSGPMALIYWEYIHASWAVLQGNPPHLHQFPHPTAGLLMTSVILSAIPMTLFCMVVMSVLHRRRRVRKAAHEILREHEQRIHRLQQRGELRLVFDDPLLRDAQFLLALGEDEP